MLGTKLSKEFVMVVVGLLAVSFLGPGILFSASEKSYEHGLESFDRTIDERQRRVATSLEQLNIRDAGLLGCIKNAAAERSKIHPMSSGGIDDVAELKNLYCRRLNIQSLSGMEKMSQLQFLDISYNIIDDIGPLSGMTSLKSLYLNQNPIEDIDAIKTLTGLTNISLPTLPHTRCDKLERVLGDIKSNIRSTGCIEDTQKFARQNDEKKRELKRKNDADRYTLTDREESEILDYQYDLRRKIE